MSARDTLQRLLDSMPEERLRDVLDFAEFVSWRTEREGWKQVGQSHFARAHGPNEPDYSTADLKREQNP